MTMNKAWAKALFETAKLSASKKRRWRRGVTLVEVLIVVAIMALIAGGAALLVFP